MSNIQIPRHEQQEYPCNPKTGKNCPFTAQLITDPKTGQAGFVNQSFCPYCLFYNSLLNRCKLLDLVGGSSGSKEGKNES